MLKWSIVLPALLMAGWLILDGSRALLIGDYLTPDSGADVAQLGPWAKVVQSLGLDPRSTPMKLILLCYGVAWLVSSCAFLLSWPWAGAAMLLAAIGILWYAPFGTLVGMIEIILLLLWRQSTGDA